jgi:hypothetical protein
MGTLGTQEMVNGEEKIVNCVVQRHEVYVEL